MLCLESRLRLSQGNKEEGLDESVFSPCRRVVRVGRDKAQKQSTAIVESKKDKYLQLPPSSTLLWLRE